MFHLVEIDHEITHYGVGYIGERKCVNERESVGFVQGD